MDVGSGAESVVTLNEKRVLGPRQEESGLSASLVKLSVLSGKRTSWVCSGPIGMALKASRFTSAVASWNNNRYASPGLSFTV